MNKNNSNNSASSLLRLAVTVFVAGAVVVDAWPWQSKEQQASSSTVSLNELQSYWMHNGDIIDDLLSSSNQTYEKLWIRPHSCVWSECAVDDMDDQYMGDNRDGDGQWYQYRTQGFCANAAYSLYGMKKTDSNLFRRGCTSRHFINSFFTYGGADNLLKAIGKTPVVYYNNNDNDGDDANGDDAYNDDANGDDAYNDDANGDDAYNDDANGDDANNDDANGDDAYNDDDDDSGYSSSGNAVCVEEIDFEAGDDDYLAGLNNNNGDDGYDDGSGSGSNDKSGSQDQDDGYYSGTLGCGPQGEYLIAAFQSSSCDGNYFAGVVDDFDEYNEQHNAIGCQKIYDQEVSINNNAVLKLLYNSWVCDLRLYPKGCPDPFGKKAKYDIAVDSAAQGRNPTRAYRSISSQRPLNVLNYILLIATAMIVVVTYLVKNRSRAMESKGGTNIRGYMLCLLEDIAIVCRQFCDWTASTWHAFALWSSNKGKELNNKNKECSKTNDNGHVSSSKVRNDNNSYSTSSSDDSYNRVVD